MIQVIDSDIVRLAPVVQRADNFIHWIGRYAANMCVQEFPFRPII